MTYQILKGWFIIQTNRIENVINPPYADIIHAMGRQSFVCEGLGLTYTDSLLIGGEFTEDMLIMGRADSNLREGCKFLRHLVQQSSHLQQKHHSQFSGLKKRDHVVFRGFQLSWRSPAHLSVVVLKVAQLETLLQFGVMPHPELIESPFGLIQLRKQSDRGAERETEMKMDFKKKRQVSNKEKKHSEGENE